MGVRFERNGSKFVGQRRRAWIDRQDRLRIMTPSSLHVCIRGHDFIAQLRRKLVEPFSQHIETDTRSSQLLFRSFMCGEELAGGVCALTSSRSFGLESNFALLLSTFNKCVFNF